MANATFDTPDGEEVQIDPAEVVNIHAGDEPETTVIELEDGEEITVAATRREVVAELDLDPLEFRDPDEDDDLDDAAEDSDTFD